jgi:nucleotide-binding universal stress UspA family protein
MARILVGLDGSPRSQDVLAAAVTAARAAGGKLLLFRSIGLPADVPQDLWKTTDEPLLDVLRSRAKAYLEAQAATVPPELLDGQEIAIGAPWEALCEAARRDGAALLVVGSHGYTGLDHVLGTTAAKVVNHAPCSVLVVRRAKA